MYNLKSRNVLLAERLSKRVQTHPKFHNNYFHIQQLLLL